MDDNQKQPPVPGPMDTAPITPDPEPMTTTGGPFSPTEGGGAPVNSPMSSGASVPESPQTIEASQGGFGTPDGVSQETIVVPSSGNTNPFIPQSASSDTAGTASGQTGHAGGNPWIKRLIILAVGLFAVILLVVLGRFLFGLFSGSKDVTISYWGLWENDAVVSRTIEEFQELNPGITVVYEKANHKQYRERLQAAIARGEGPDVFRFHNTWIPMLAGDLEPVPPDVMSAGEFANTFYPVASNDLVTGSTIYGIPLMIDGIGLYINSEIFESAGVSAPATWEEVLALVPKLTVKEDETITTSAIALGTTNNVEHMSDIVATMMMQNGANLVSPTGLEAEEALIFYRKFADANDPYYTWNEGFDNSIYAFATGRVAMMIAPSWRAFDIKQISPDLRFTIAPIPQLPGNRVTWASYWVEGVSSKSENKEAAFKFVDYLTSSETATKLFSEASKARLFGEPYARVDLGVSLADDPYVGAFMSQAPDARSFPLASRTFDNGLNDKMIQYLTDAINSVSAGGSPADALETVASGFAQVLSSYGLTTSTR